jgi:hypothetical protein
VDVVVDALDEDVDVDVVMDIDMGTGMDPHVTKSRG